MNLAVVGSRGVGKTSWVRRLIRGTFQGGYHVNKGHPQSVIYRNTRITVYSGSLEDYVNAFPRHSAYMVMFSVNNSLSMISAMRWMKTIRSKSSKPIILCGNMCDQTHKATLKDFVRRGLNLGNVKYVEISNKINYQVREPLAILQEGLVEQ